MSKLKIDNYTFDKTAKTVTFTSYTTIQLDDILLITNVTDNIIIYNFADATKGGTVLTNVLTLTYDTSSMDNSDKLLIYYYDENLIPIEYAMDKANSTPLQVQLPIDLKQELDGGLILADMKGPIVWSSLVAAQPIRIDCTGYQSVLVHKITTGVVTPYVSNDGKTWSATYAIATATSIPSATILTAAGMYVLPVVSKWLQLVGPASAIQCFIYLSQTPCIIVPYLNIAGTPAITGGIAGSLAVGGNVATGLAPTANPVQIGGVDALKVPLTRRMLVDQLGRQQIGNTPSQLTAGINKIGYDPIYRNILEVQDTSITEEGQSRDELLLQILKELKILNLQLFEMPRLLNDGQAAIDEPDTMRNDNTLFN
jgi:hypothetical protein